MLSTSFAIAADANNNNTANSKWRAHAAKLDSTDVYDFHGQKLVIDQALIDPQTGRARYGVLEVDNA